MLKGQTQPAGDESPLWSSLKSGRGNNFTQDSLLFCRALRDRKVKVTTGRIIDSYRSFHHIDLTQKSDFYVATRANLVSNQHEIKVFDDVFREFWDLEDFCPDDPEENAPGRESTGLGPESCNAEDQEPGGKGQGETGKGDPRGEGEEEIFHMPEEAPDAQGEDTGPRGDDNFPSYSPHEALSVKDFGSFKGEEVEEIRRLIAKLAPKLATRLGRRKQATHRRKLIDLRRTIRKNLRYGGEVVRLFHRKRKIKKNELVLICDVSGSMDAYSQFLVQFIYGLQNEIRNVQTAVFSTRLTVATPHLKERYLQKALARLSERVHDWSGGTNIEGCLKTFNERWGNMMVSKHTTVILISDGWDRGDIKTLDLELRRLRNRCRRLIWLNPLLGSPGYKPIDRGMRTALPYIDKGCFLPAHNLQSLEKLVEVLRLN